MESCAVAWPVWFRDWDVTANTKLHGGARPVLWPYEMHALLFMACLSSRRRTALMLQDQCALHVKFGGI
jgi:hypothetical protein